MKYKCVKDSYCYDTIVALKGDIVEIDNSTLYNLSRKTVFKDTLVITNMINTGVLIKETKKDDKVNHPSHYTWLKEKCGIEVIDITRHMDFCLGNAIKYLLRAGHKTEDGLSYKEKYIEDLKKAIFYINDKINQIKNDKTKNTD